jgi:hypothetical protein
MVSSFALPLLAQKSYLIVNWFLCIKFNCADLKSFQNLATDSFNSFKILTNHLLANWILYNIALSN